MNIDDIKWICEKAGYEITLKHNLNNFYNIGKEQILLKAMFALIAEGWGFTYFDELMYVEKDEDVHLITYLDIPDNKLKALESAILYIKGVS